MKRKRNFCVLISIAVFLLGSFVSCIKFSKEIEMKRKWPVIKKTYSPPATEWVCKALEGDNCSFVKKEVRTPAMWILTVVMGEERIIIYSFRVTKKVYDKVKVGNSYGWSEMPLLAK